MRIAIIVLLSLILISCQKNTKMRKEVVVIGGGLMGSSVAWQLSQAGVDVLLLEQQDSVYTYGSSFGESRISRSLGPKNDIFSYLQQTSVAETKKLISYLNEVDKEEQHSMEDIYTTSPITYLYYNSQQDHVDNLLVDQKDTIEYASNSSAALDMFDMKVPDSVMVIREYKKYTGILNPKALISKLHQAIKFAGGQVLYNQRVTGLSRKKEGFEIRTENLKTGATNTNTYKKIVTAAGAYTGNLLANVAPYFDQLINPKRLFLAYFKIDKERYDMFSDQQKKRLTGFYPMAEWHTDIFYSMIEKYDSKGIPIIKVGGHLLWRDFKNLDEVWQQEVSNEEIEWSRVHTLNYLEMIGLNIDAASLIYFKGYSCVYSLTQSEVPYVTHIVDKEGGADPDFVVLGGMSGVGAKGSLAYGLIASDLLLKKESNNSPLYSKTKAALGFERLLEDMERVSN